LPPRLSPNWGAGASPGVALELVRIALHTGDCDEHVRQAIANKLIALAKAGEGNPDVLCEQALAEMRRPELEGEA
jgi:hypothetical protein